MNRLWLGLALWGTVHPMYYFLSYMQAEGVGLAGLSRAWYVNASTTGLTWDLIIAALSLTVWVIYEASKTRDGLRLLAIPATFCIGVSCGLPLYLYLRGRRG
ncbi:DUF2834 domain-containing protein [uncultured Lentibacter sp.]|uniref:DUF2834 domain-containing protein n=1 Tax=uncultured Lentibacter sp. TaxID=1659309 RepID=UPI00261A869A|nr:DUF2834 domain-containing protein [uncultured Lentibacter sp.]